MKLILINLYSSGVMAQYLLSSYVLKAYLNKVFDNDDELAVDILNYSSSTKASKIFEKIINGKPDYVGYSCYIWNIEKVLEVAGCLRDHADFIQIFGGPEISLNRIASFANPTVADYYVIGEGERTLTNLLRCLKTNSKTAKAEIPKGVAYWNGKRIVYTGDAEKITDLNKIPSVYLTGTLDDRLYARQQAFLETQRGCKHKCKYCVYHKHLSSIAFYSLRRVFDELDYLIIKKPVMAVRIFDAVFTSDLQRAKEIVQHLLNLKQEGVRLPLIYWEFTYNSIDEEFIKLVALLKNRTRILNTIDVPPLDRPQFYSDLLKGYTAVNCIGVQSFNKQVLKAVNRTRINLEKFTTFMNISRNYNIVLKIDLILGLPFETFNSYFEGLEFFLPFFKNTDHILNVHRLQILPGAELETLCNAYRIIYSREAPHLVFSTNTLSRQELSYASKLTAILFRILNSPLRQSFFDVKERIGKSFYNLIKTVLDAITSSEKLKDTRLVQSESVDDNYWNDEIFREIPSDWLIDFLTNYDKSKQKIVSPGFSKMPEV